MGQKHNRRRTRSRPRNRGRNPAGAHSRITSFDGDFSLASPQMQPYQSDRVYSYPQSAPVGRAAAEHWDSQYAAWQERARIQRDVADRCRWQRVMDDEMMEPLEDERLFRMFGGERGDETSLCGPMLQVVMDLFDGIDYEDP